METPLPALLIASSKAANLMEMDEKAEHRYAGQRHKMNPVHSRSYSHY